METPFYGQWQIDNNIDILVAENNLLNYLRRAGEGKKLKKMSQKLRAKFIVSHSTDYGGYDQVVMNSVYSQNRATEDNQFSEATPSGELKMMISSKGGRKFLKPGVKYILTFEEAEHQD